MTVPGAHEYVLLLAESRGTCFCDGDEGWTEVQGVRIELWCLPEHVLLAIKKTDRHKWHFCLNTNGSHRLCTFLEEVTEGLP